MDGGFNLAGQLWVRLEKKTKRIKDSVAPCPEGNWLEALNLACHELDLPLPLVLTRHLRDWESHRSVRFLPEHFMESVNFDRMEVEFFDPDDRDTKHRSEDPRNG